jgi:hypothetical protein
VLKRRDADLRHWYLASVLEFIRNTHFLANLEKLKIRNPSSALRRNSYNNNHSNYNK